MTTPNTTPTCDCTALRERLATVRAELTAERAERLAIAALFGIEPCHDDRPHSWVQGGTGEGSVSLLDLMEGEAMRLDDADRLADRAWARSEAAHTT